MSYIGEFYQGIPGKPTHFDFGAETYDEYLYRLGLFIQHLYKGGTRMDFDVDKAIKEDRERRIQHDLQRGIERTEQGD